MRKLIELTGRNYAAGYRIYIIAWLGARFPAHLLNTEYGWMRLLDLVLEHLYNKFQWIEDVYFGGVSDNIHACRKLVISH